MDQPSTFAALLRAHRKAIPLSQQELSLRSKISVRAIGYLEQGRILNPQAETVRMLAETLGLSGDLLWQFEEIARGRLVDDFPAPRAHNLPHPTSVFIGRECELAALQRQFVGADAAPDDTAARRRSRLVTLVGAGGCGKTRFALETAWALLPAFADGVWLVELAALDEPRLVGEAVAGIFAVRTDGDGDVNRALIAHLRERELLLLLDNCEHLSAACAVLVRELLRHCPRLRILATSREPLRIDGETVRRMPSLTLPPDCAAPGPEAVRRSEAARFFALHAADVAPDFAITAENAALVAQICLRLDGLPLALELAAARLAALGLAEVAARLDQRFSLLTGGSRAALPRHQTLRAALDWSYELLTEAERSLLCRLAVFSGGCTLDTVELICAGDGLDPAEIADLLGRLVDKSLVGVLPAAGDARRYGLLETVRDYSLERLAARGEVWEMRNRHVEWCLALAQSEPTPLNGGAASGVWLDWVGVELGNVRAALRWTLDHDAAAGLRLAGAIWPYWFSRGSLPEGRLWLGQFLDRAGADARWRASGLYGLGYLTLFRDVAAARTHLAEALALSEGRGDAALGLAIRCPLAYACFSTGALEEANRHLTAGAALAAREAQPGLRGLYRMLRGYLAWQHGRVDEAEGLLRQALDDTRAAGQLLFQCMVIARLGEISLKRGDVARASAQFETLRRTADHLGTAFYRSLARYRLGTVHEATGDLAAAEAVYTASLALIEGSDSERVEQAAHLLGLGRIALFQRRYNAAVTRLGRAAAVAADLKDQRLLRALAYPLAVALWCHGQRPAARAQLRAALDLWAVGGEQGGLGLCLLGAAVVAAVAGDAPLAACWYGAARTLDAAVARDPQLARLRAATLGPTRCAALEAPALAAARDAGGTLPLPEVIAEIGAWLDAAAALSPPRALPPASPAYSLPPAGPSLPPSPDR